ncbi:uncharacterized protein LOC123308409 [Coccinella septempunctata]|uniref:uncharacterized protein LOC123308409 n=1 Tax=Coccinella septempunctata TaxID=41139 RepID=UPI001D08B01E|nr:uncharacterized protein LOC123308409 [Coccinella septempunctata]
MFINCFLVLMILSQNIPSPTEAKPYFTKIHRLNSVRDFDDIVDWTCNQNVKNQKQEPKGSKQITDNPSIQERSISSEAPDATSKSGELIEKRSDVSVHFETGETARATERMQVSIMPSPPSRKYASSDTARGTERMEVSEMPSPPSREDQKDDKKRSEMEEIKDVVDENEDNKEEFGEGFSNLYKKMRNKMKKKKCKTCLTNIEEEFPMKFEDIEDDKSKVKYILPYRRSAPLCLLNDRRAAGYYQTAAVPVIRPVLMSAPQPIYIQGSPNDDRSPLYEVEWLQHPSVATSVFRKRREIDNWYPKRAYPFMVDRECDHNDKVSQAHKELVCMIRAVKSEFLNKNNLTFLPILFVPHCDSAKPCPDIPGSPELGQLSFQNVDPSNMKEKEEEPHQCHCAHPKDPAPKKEKNNETICINIGHMTIILLANNTLSVVFPAPSQEPEMPECPEPPDTPDKPQQEAHSHRPQPSQSCCPPLPPPCCPPPPPPPQPEPVCFPPCPSPCPCPCPYPCRASEKNTQFKRNVIDNLKQYLENAFNFIDIRRVLTEDELHDRTSRDTFKRFGSDIIPGILLYPKRYGPTLAKNSREATNFDFEETGAPISDFYCFTTNGNCGGKFKRSLNSKKIGITEGDIAAEEAQLEIEKKQAQLEKEMQIDLNLDKEVVEALNVASTTTSLAASEQMKKDEEYLEKENQEMVRNEQLLEAPDTGEEPTEQTCLFTEPLITEEIEPISSATDSIIENMSAEALAMAEAGKHLDDAKGPEAEELEATEEALTETPVECPDPCPPEECGEQEPCQPDDEPCPPPCNEPTPPCHLPTSDEIGVNQTDLANGSKGKATKSVAEFENEMLGIIDNSKKESLANEEKRKGVFDITTKHSWKVKKKRKSKRVRGLRAGQRNRRDLKATIPSTPEWKDPTTTSKMAVRDVETETTELVKVTFKETTTPVAICEEVEDVTEVLFTTKPSQEQMELECNEVKEAAVTSRSTTQKLGVPITIVITKSTEGVSTTTELPSVLSEFVQPPLRDENDETVTEKLNRLLRDLGLVKQVQSFLQGIKDTGYEIRDAVRRRTQRETQNDIGGLVTGRKLFSMEVHAKYSETKGPLQQFRRRTYRRRSGESFKRYSRDINDNIKLYPGKANMDRISSENNEESKDFTGSEKNRRWKKYAGNWVEWVPNFEPFLEPNYQNYQF